MSKSTGMRAGTGGYAAIKKWLAVSVLVVIAACSPIERNHGYIPLDADLAQLAIGVDTRETVIEKVGSPTAAGALNAAGYYYVASRFERIGPFAPREADRQVVAITFQPDGTLRNVERFGLERGQVVTLSRRVTDAGTGDLGFIRQLMGNLGRFDAGTVIGDGS